MNTYGPTLERGLLTLREAEVIQTILSEQGEEAAIQRAHSLQSDVSQSFSNGKIAGSEVMDAYHLYARHSMMIAIGEQSLGSQALYGWGQLCSTRAQTDAYEKTVETGKAQTLLAASLEADQQNWRAHNELGVIHARNGDYDKSEKALRRSLAIQPRNETYNNIAMVLDQQGEGSLASEARSRGERSTLAGTSSRVGSAQVGAEQPLPEESRRDKVRKFVDRLMGTDSQYANSYEDDDGIPVAP